MGKQNLITFQLMAISGILLSILVSMVAFRQFTLPQSQADLATVAGLTVPYVRLEEARREMIDGKSVVWVEVIVNSGGLSVIGADLLIDFDETQLAVNREQIESTGAFAVISQNTQTVGVLDFSLFSSVERDEPIVQTNVDQEIAIAEIPFEIVASNGGVSQLQVRYIPNSLSDTNLILLQDPRPELPTDVLKSIRGLILTL
jgi:hypothetical protein